MKYHYHTFLQKKSTLALINLTLALFLSFYHKNDYDIQEWDEARNGVNAYEMLQNKDFVNLYYEGKPDTWNAKPPLLIWMIAGSYSLFGYNEFALRFPIALAILVFFLLCFETISLLDKPKVAILTCLILMSCKAVLGNHIGLTADFDGLLLVFLTASVYFFIRFIEQGQKNNVFYVALFTGLAFYTKGPASLTLLPGFLIYILLKKEWWVLKCWQTWGALLLLLGIVFSWLGISKIYGIITPESFYGSKNALETMFFYDTFQRFTNPAFDITGQQSNIYLFFFEVIDARLNLWNYVFYLGVLAGAIKVIKNKSKILHNKGTQMIILSFCLILPLALVLTIASTKNNWYLAPTFMFIAYIVIKTILYFGEKNKTILLMALLLFTFTFTRQIYYLSTLSVKRHDVLSKNKALLNQKVLVIGTMQQDVILYLKWLNVKMISKPYKLKPGEEIWFIRRDSANEQFVQENESEPLTTFDDYLIGRLKTKASYNL